MRPLLTLLLLAALSPAAPVPKGMKSKSSSLVGTWKPSDGTQISWFVFAEDGTLKTWIERAVGRVESPMEWTWAIDAEATTPQRLTLTRTTEHGTKMPYDCAFELDGDTLRFAFLNGGKLPAKLAAAPNTVHVTNFTRDTSGK